MEAFLASLDSLDQSITADVNILSEVARGEQAEQAVDRIRINLSAHLSEIRMIVVDKVRLRQVTLNTENQLHSVDGCILVALCGKVNNPSTTRAIGAYAVVWNKKHKINISNKNILTIKSASSSHTLGLLALVTQMEVLKIKKVIIVTTSPIVKTIIDETPRWASQQFLMQNNTLMINHRTLSNINDIINKNSLRFDVLQLHNMESPLREVGHELVEVAMRDIHARLGEIRAETA